MGEDHRDIIRKNRVYLVENLDVTKTSLLDHLVQEGVLNQDQHAAIKDKYSLNNQLASAILDQLHKSTSADWLTFLSCVSRCGQDHIIMKVSEDPEVKRLQYLLADKILAFHNTTEIWEKEDEFREVSIDDIFVDSQLNKEKADEVSNGEEEKVRGYQDIYNQLSKNKTVVIFGHPGTGKSVLSKRLCCDWAKLLEENAMDISYLNLHNFSFILPISLLAVKNNKTFQEYVCETYKMKRKDSQSLYNIIEKKQESVVLVLDEKENYDEKTSEEMTRLLYRQLFPRVKMLITSRSLSLPTFCNDSYSPIATLSLQGFSDDRVKQYARKLYSTEAERFLSHLEKLKSLEYGEYVTHYPAFLQMLLRINMNEIHKNTTVEDTVFCIEYVAYTIRRAQRKRRRLITAEKSIDQILNEHRTLFKLLGQLVKVNVKPQKMELKFTNKQVINIPDEVKSEFLFEQRDDNGKSVYMFIHKRVPEFFLSYYLLWCSISEQEDILLDFCNCRAAFKGTAIVEMLEGFNEKELANDIRKISRGEEDEMGELHTKLQLKCVEKYEDARLVLPEIMYLSPRGYGFPWDRYLGMDGSNIVKLILDPDEHILNSLQQLNAPNLSSLTLLMNYLCSTENFQQIERTLSRFSPKSLEIQGGIYMMTRTEYAAVTAACKLAGVEELKIFWVRLDSEIIQNLKQKLQDSVLKTLTISHCDLNREQLCELVDAVSASASLESLDISATCGCGIVDDLANKTEKFRNLKKLNLTENLFLYEEKKQEITEKLKMYPQLKLNI